MRDDVNLLLFLNRHPQPEGASEDQITAVEVGEELHGLARHFHAHPETVINVALEHLHMVLGIGAGLRRLEFVHRTRGQAVLRLEP